MTAVATITATAFDSTTENRVDLAARRMYDAEVTLHAARQAHVDAWIEAACRRLHEAVQEHSAALAAAPGILTTRDGSRS
jgi:hypothetical protein